jgi:hypothetical protein
MLGVLRHPIGDVTLKQTLRHGVAAAGFVGLAVVWSYPLIRHLSTNLPGAGMGDNTLFLWNFWWMRTALALRTDFFRTAHLFAPIGVDLTLHTHTALPALIGATFLRRLPVTTALNVTILEALALNGFCAYLLAWRLTRKWGAALIAGIVFGSSPYVGAHLNGHFNLTNAWTLPLFALTVPLAITGSKKWALLSGAVLALTVYIDYYYVVYEMMYSLCLVALAAATWSLSIRPVRRLSLSFVVVAICILVDAVAMIAIASTGGFDLTLGPIRASMHDTYNPLQLFWMLVALAVVIRVRPHVTLHYRETWSWNRSAIALLVMLGTFVLAGAPIVWRGVRLVALGQYVTQGHYWRSAPRGIDVATLLLGDPFNGLWGAAVGRLYSKLGIDIIEGGAWLGLAPPVLVFYALRKRMSEPLVQQWAVVGLMFFIWALGPHLMVFGRNSGMILPEALLPYVPVASNARMPGRAIVMVYLAIAMLAAVGAADWSYRSTQATLRLSLIGVVGFADFLHAPFPTAETRCPSIYAVLRDRPEHGALAELPLGFGNGLTGELTPVDHRMFVCQSLHERPLVGGTLARLPSNVFPAYQADPLLAAWLRLSGSTAPIVKNRSLPDAALARERFRTDDIAFLMLNRDTASPALQDYVDRVLPVTVVMREQNLVLYRTNR